MMDMPKTQRRHESGEREKGETLVFRYCRDCDRTSKVIKIKFITFFRSSKTFVHSQRP